MDSSSGGGGAQIKGMLTHDGRYVLYNVYGNLFEVSAKYAPPIRPIGRGAYGIVCAAVNSETKEEVAIKKIGNAFDNHIDAKRTLREIKLLRHMDHENIIAIKDIIRPPTKENFTDVYLVTELMDTDLHQIIRSNQPLTDDHCQMESVCENTVSMDFKPTKLSNFVPFLRSGDWSDIGSRDCMEDAHVCISDLAKNYGCNSADDEVISFYGVFDGHGGKDAAHYVRDNLPRVIVEDADFPLELEKVVKRSFMQTDSKFAETCSNNKALSSGTTALTAMIFGRSLLVANAGDCRAVLSRHGTAIEMSKDHRTCCMNERRRVESLGGFVDDGYLNGQLAVTRALGDWHLEGMKESGHPGGPLSAEPELKMITLTKDDEFLIIGSDGIWDYFSNQNAVDFARKKLQEHNDLRLCCKQIVEEAIRLGSRDNLTAVMVSFHQEAPPIRVSRTGRVARSISAEGLHSIRVLLEGQ